MTPPHFFISHKKDAYAGYVWKNPHMTLHGYSTRAVATYKFINAAI